MVCLQSYATVPGYTNTLNIHAYYMNIHAYYMNIHAYSLFTDSDRLNDEQLTMWLK